MAQNYIQLSGGQYVATDTNTWNGQAGVHAQVMQIGDFSQTNPFVASVTAPGTTGTYGLSIQGMTGGLAIPVSLVGTSPISGSVSVLGTATIAGSVSLNGTSAISGAVSLLGTSAISGSVSIAGTPSVTISSGSVTALSGTGSNAFLAQSVSGVAAGTSSGVIKTGAGRCFGVVITATGTSGFTLTDGPSGNILVTIPADAPIGDYIPSHSKPFSTSLYGNLGASTPAFTVLYS